MTYMDKMSYYYSSIHVYMNAVSFLHLQRHVYTHIHHIHHIRLLDVYYSGTLLELMCYIP